MTLADFNRDWMPILQLIVGFAGLGSLWLAWWQITKTSAWNRRISQHNFLNNPFSLELDKSLYAAADKLGITLHARREALSEEEVTKILQDKDAYACAIAYLNEFENVCGAVRADIADPDVAYGIHSARVITKFPVYKPFIEKLRKLQDDDEIFIEFENVYDAWLFKAAKIAERKEKKRPALKSASGIPTAK